MTRRLTEEDVRRVAVLSRLSLSDEEIEHFTHQLSSVLDYMAKLNELDVDGVEPMGHAIDMSNVMREDVPQQGLTVNAVLANAPDRSPPFFKVPKVLGDASGA